MPARCSRYSWAAVLLICGLAAVSWFPALPAVQARRANTPAVQTAEAGLPPQGMYDSCLITEAECVQHLEVLAERGFKLILNYGQLYASSAAQIAYADRAQALGMQIIWSINYRAEWTDDNLLSKYADLAAECDCTDNLGLIAYFVNLVKDHPATWGYYLADEVAPQEHDRLLQYSALIKQLDPDHPRLFIAAGSNDPMELYFNFPSFMRDTVDMVGPCYYPYGYIDSGQALTRYTGEAARVTQTWAARLGLQPAIVLQAFSQVRYAHVPLCLPWPACAPFPSYDQMKAQRDQVLLNSRPAIILWWTYQDILQTDNPTRHLDDLAAAAFAPLPEPIPAPAPVETACPPRWNCADIGSPRLSGTQSRTAGTWTISASGWDIWTRMWEKADQFRFIWQTQEGDLAASARLVSQSDTDPYAKAGLMFRKTFDPLSPYYAVLVTPARGIRVQYRAGFIEKSHTLAILPGSAPVFLKLEKNGATFQAFTSTDGVRWSLIPGSTRDLPEMTGELMAGMAVSSHDDTELGSASFEHLILHRPQSLYAGIRPLYPIRFVVSALLAFSILHVVLLHFRWQGRASQLMPPTLRQPSRERS